MVSPFSSDLFKNLSQLHTDAIGALIDSDECNVPCRLVYGVSKYNVCSNCLHDVIGKKSSNRYKAGGPIPFQNGSICPMCGGAGRIPATITESIKLVVIWDRSSFINLGDNSNIQSSDQSIQTFSRVSTMPKLKKALEIIIDTDIEGYDDYRFTRTSKPVPCGFGVTSFIITNWKSVT